MVRDRQTEVLVVGAGPVGLFSAVILADRGVGLELVDESFRPATHGYALALHPRSLELLDSVGLAEQLIAQGQRIERVAFYDREGRRAQLDLGKLEARFPFALALPQRELERVLAERLASRKVDVRWSQRASAISVEGDRVVATVDTLDRVSGGYPVATTHAVVVSSSVVRARFVVGADGARSTVRARLGADFEAIGSSGLFGVFEAKADFEPADEMRVVLDDSAASSLWPIGHQRWRWSFQLEEPIRLPPRRPGESRPVVQIGDRSYPGLSADRLAELVAARAPWFNVPVDEIYWALMVGFERRLASVLGQGPLWIAGDAAHTTLPIGMQSMNAGLEEAYQLAGAMADHVRGRTSEAIFGYYQRDRAEDLRTMMGMEGRLAADAKADPWVAQRASRLVECIPAGGDELEQLLGQLHLQRATPTS